MADSTLDSQLFVLFDNWPGVAEKISAGEVPAGGFAEASAVHHNVAAAQYDIGQKLCVLNTDDAGIEGMSTFIYLQVGTQNADSVIAAKSLVVPGSATLWYQVSNNPDANILVAGSSMAAYALSAMTDAYFGWFWCGGVCPESFVSGLGGTYATDGTVAAGMISSGDLAADYLGLVPYATTVGYLGFALAADA